jgi:hypothetical protein
LLTSPEFCKTPQVIALQRDGVHAIQVVRSGIVEAYGVMQHVIGDDEDARDYGDASPFLSPALADAAECAPK